MQLLTKETHGYQSDLARYCRSGVYTPIPGVRADNIGQYRRLVFNVVDDTLQSAYPLTYALLSEEEWEAAVNEFFTHHNCQSPQVWYMPKEFLEFLTEQDHALTKKYPQLADLLHFEWLEIEAYMMEDVEAAPYREEGNIKQDVLVANPEIRVAAFAYPVHKMRPAEITEAQQGTYFVSVHRHPESGSVFFSELGLPHVQVLELLHSGEPVSYMQMKDVFAQSGLGAAALDAFLEAGLANKLILGYFTA